MNNECITLKEAGYTQKITVHITTTAVTGKKFVGPITGRQSGGLGGLSADPLSTGDGSDYTIAGPPAAHGAVAGVAGWDQTSGNKVPIIRGAGTILPVTSGGAVTAGDLLAVDATGGVITAASGYVIVGRALTTVAGTGLDVEVELFDLDPKVVD